MTTVELNDQEVGFLATELSRNIQEGEYSNSNTITMKHILNKLEVEIKEETISDLNAMCVHND